MSHSLHFAEIKKGVNNLDVNQNSNIPLPSDGTIERIITAQCVNGKFIGASLLCFSIDPYYSRVYFLLGQERKAVKWPGGSEKYSDFGGSCRNSAEQPEHTAAREFVEETMGMVKYFENDTIPRTEYVDILESLKKGEYTFKITIGFGTIDKHKNYIIFMKQIPWDPRCTYRFETCRNMLLNPMLYLNTPKWNELIEKNKALKKITDITGNVHFIVNKDFLEKKKLNYFSIPQLQFAIENHGILTRRNGVIERCRSSFVQVIELVLSELMFADPTYSNE